MIDEKGNVSKMKPITIEDIDLFSNRTCHIINSEYQFSTMFIWQECFGFQYELFKNTLLVFGYQHNGNLQAYCPIGPEEEFKESVFKIIEIFHSQKRPYNFRPLNKSMKDKITALLAPNFIIGSKESYSDYIYDFKALCSFEGKEYKHKRKDWNRFSSRYDYTYEPIVTDNCHECFEALSRMVTEELNYDPDEINAYKKVFANYDKMDVRGGLIRINGTVEAVAVGEAIGNMVLMHLRRCNKKYVGIYPSMLRIFLKKEFNDRDYSIVNTQDDMGMLTIRKAKMSYRPLYLLKKYYLEEPIE